MAIVDRPTSSAAPTALDCKIRASLIPIDLDWIEQVRRPVATNTLFGHKGEYSALIVIRGFCGAAHCISYQHRHKIYIILPELDAVSVRWESARELRKIFSPSDKVGLC